MKNIAPKEIVNVSVIVKRKYQIQTKIIVMLVMVIITTYQVLKSVPGHPSRSRPLN